MAHWLWVEESRDHGWIADEQFRSPTYFPTTNGRRLSVNISSSGPSVSLIVRGPLPAGRILFQLSSFINNMAETSSGSANQKSGTVTWRPMRRASLSPSAQTRNGDGVEGSGAMTADLRV